jgi:4-diphosphocytidyl-2-C-methyl-D-erythritol kinase
MLVRAYAKINLGLRILRKRTDGYHDIETLFHRIDLFDEILLERADRILLSSSSPGVPDNEDNLCILSARAIQKHTSSDQGVSIALRKNIPVGAGLGGGSSDAAAVLLGLESLWKVKLQPAERLEIARKLGADVPYFLREGSASASGIAHPDSLGVRTMQTERKGLSPAAA